MGQTRNRNRRTLENRRSEGGAVSLKEWKEKRQLSGDEADEEREERSDDIWAPNGYTAMKALLSARLCSALWNNIHDCDETYNYWEPTHFMLYGTGFQTWEYSPDFALRSYSYVALHAFPAFLYSWLLQSNKMLVFYFLRWILAFVCALCEVHFYRGICSQLGSNVGRITLGFLVLSAGMFHCATAYLPSTFAMYMCLLSMGSWFRGMDEVAVVSTAISAVFGWPFAALLGVPIAIDMLFRRKVWKVFAKSVAMSVLLVVVPVIYIDSQMYGRLTFPALNIVLYNVFRGGSELYGTEPWTYYIVNGLLNFNVVFLLGLLALPLAMLIEHLTGVGGRTIPYPLVFLGLYLWLGVFMVQPHKEERFLYPVYPLLCLGAGTALDVLQKLYFCLYAHLRWGEEGRRLTHYLHHTNWIAAVTIVASGLLGLSRILAVFRGYHAPMEAFMEVNQLGMSGEVSLDKPINVCLGKEWHRFPSHFFLPSSQWKAQFLRSEFRGQLPQHYSQAPDATSVPPPHMNDRNAEEPSRYVEPWMCEFLVDVEFADGETEAEPHFSADTENWTLVKSWPFLDAARSPQFLRAFYVPFLTPEYCEYGSYVLLRSTRRKRRRHKGS